MTITLSYKGSKGGYHQFVAPGMRGTAYFAKAAFVGDPSAVKITVEGQLAVPGAGKPVDPAVLQAAADKATAKAAKAQARAAALAAQLAALQTAAAPAPTEPTPAPAEQAPRLVGKGGRK
jgi:hypothetical protein